MANNNDNSGAPEAEDKTGFEDKSMDELKTLLESEKDVEALQKVNRELFGRATRAEAKLKVEGSGGPAPRTGTNKSDEESAPWEEYAALQASGLSPAEIVEVGKLAKRFHITPSEVLADPVIKAGFDATRKKAQVGARTLPPDRRSSGGSAAPSQGNDKDTPGIKSARESFNSRLSRGEESSD